MGLLPSPADTGKVTDSLYAVRDGHVSFYVFIKGQDAVAVDCGFGKSALELSKLGIDPEKVPAVFLTHSDRDHVGGLGLFKNAKVLYMSKDEEQMIDGRKPRFLWFVKNKIPTEKPLNFLVDGETIIIGMISVKAISTPGHTPGSMSYLIDDSVLFTGDALVVKDGKVMPSLRFLNKDNHLVEDSIRKLAKLDNVSILCTAHSGMSKDYPKIMSDWRK